MDFVFFIQSPTKYKIKSSHHTGLTNDNAMTYYAVFSTQLLKRCVLISISVSVFTIAYSAQANDTATQQTPAILSPLSHDTEQISPDNQQETILTTIESDTTKTITENVNNQDLAPNQSNTFSDDFSHTTPSPINHDKINNKATIEKKEKNAEANDISWLELMDALAQFGDKKKLDNYIQAYYQDNPDVAYGNHPHLFYDAAITGMINFLHYLIKYYPERLFINYKKGPTVLGYIAGDNQLAIARTLLKAGIDPNDTGNTEATYPLSLAINSGNLQMITLLLEFGANVHIGSAYHSPLGLLLDNNDLETLKVIDAYDFTLDPLDDELRQLVIAYLNAELVEEEILSILVHHGFDPRLYTSKQPSFLEMAKTQVKSPDVLAMFADLSHAYDLAKQADNDKGNSPSSSTNFAEEVMSETHQKPINQ